MSRTYEEIFAEAFDNFKENQLALAEIERNRIVSYCQIRIDHHYGCRGLVSTCEQCILLRQIIDYVNGEG